MLMATMSHPPSFRLPDNKAEVPQWQGYEDLFEQLIDSEPDCFSRFSGTGSIPEPSSGSSDFGHIYDEAPSAVGDAYYGGSPQLGGGDYSVESQIRNTAVPHTLDLTRSVSCEAPNRDSVASNPLSFQQLSPVSPYPTEKIFKSGGSVKNDRVLSGGIRKAYRKSSNSPRMTYPSFSRRNIDWNQRLETSAENTTSSARRDPWSPPPSDRIPQWDDAMAFGSQGSNYASNQPTRAGSYQQNQAQYATNAHTMARQQRSTPAQRQTPASTPYSTQSSTFDSLVTSPQVEGSLSWDSPLSPFQQYSVEPSPATRTFDDGKVQSWWPPHSSSYPGYSQPGHSQVQPRHHSHGDSVPMVPSQEPYSGSSSQTMAGLGINTPGFDPSYPFYPPSVSSTAYQVSQSRGQQASRLDHQHGLERQRSSSAESSSPSSPSTASRSTMASRRASRGHSASRRSKSQGSAPSAKQASQVGFVNYTPSDSKRILTGVAPSGSSKTKARREKEAAERRRRLSQAAARAVLEAGGDVAALEREGLLGYA